MIDEQQALDLDSFADISYGSMMLKVIQLTRPDDHIMLQRNDDDTFTIGMFHCKYTGTIFEIADLVRETFAALEPSPMGLVIFETDNDPED